MRVHPSLYETWDGKDFFSTLMSWKILGTKAEDYFKTSLPSRLKTKTKTSSVYIFQEKVISLDLKMYIINII